MNNRTDDLLSDWLDDGDENPASESDVPSTEAIEIVAQSLLIHGLLTDIGSRDDDAEACLLYTSPSPRDQRGSRMPSSA